ncbi:MAG: indolepyruvate ferredoxin oxidoreductase subunit alpha, partial [Clostridiales bacterium]|nr:indolepyruvate ferredoxin oxidoreductase subunit alpha [Clostridiales bacterium]
MLGNEAIARGAYEAGVKVMSSYPGTPSTEITEYAARYENISCEWAPNEKVATEVTFGAAMAGVRGMTCMKHVGVNVAADPIFTASYTGVRGGMVIVCADDPGMHSSQNEQDSRYYARAAHIPMLEPADSQECKDFTKMAFALSEQFDTPVFLRLTTRIAHARSTVVLGAQEEVSDKTYEKDAMKYVMMPGMAKKRHVVVEANMTALAEHANQLAINHVEMKDSSLGVICSGVTYQYVKEALPQASVLKLGMVHPLPKKMIRDFATQVEKLVVIEELEDIVEQQVAAMGVSVEGKNLTGFQGELSTKRIKEIFEGTQEKEKNALSDLPSRPPVLCPGCPHRGVFHGLKKLKLKVMGDIGCYTMGALP